VPWLGEVPEHWKLKRTKTVLRERSQKGFPDEPLLAATQTKGVVRKELYENRTVLALKDLHLLKLVRVNDFVISLRSFQGGIEFAHEQGIISPAYTILYPVEAQNHGFLAWLFKSKPYIENLSLFVTGIREGQNIDYVKLSRSELPLPPFSEQSSIVRYLDHIDRRIRRYIRTKQKLIKLLEEQKQAIIHQAVTRGLDPNVKLKPSGVEWLGEIPEHWEIVALKQLCSLLRDGTHLPPARQSIGVPLLSVRNIVGGRFVNRDDDSFISFSDYEQLCRSFVVQQNDVLLAIVGATLGKVAIVPAMSTFHIQRSLAIFRPKRHKLFYDYLAFFLRGPAFQRALWKTVAFSAQPGIYLSTLGAFRIAVPPLAEQKQIVLKVSQHTEQVQQAIDKARCEISLLREYRTRLIADVVTGKLDVREVAANLPEETDEKESFEDSLAEDDELENNEIEDEQAGELEEEVPA
jgi:type I restriction enzyme S subunit